MKIVVLAGGYSPERDVSLSSGSLIANSLMRSGHEVLLLDAFYGIDDLPEGTDLGTLFRKQGQGEYSYSIPEKAPDLDEMRRQARGGSLVGNYVLRLCRYADAVFVALHGDMGENGQMQAILEAEGVRFTGTDHVGCVLAMDKDISKQLMRVAQIPTADWELVDLSARKLSKISLPCVIKPCSCGSSVGVSLVRTEEELERALDEAAKYEGKIMAEPLIEGREFSVGVLNGKALPPIEILPKTGFYDYRNKYQAGSTTEICPADLPASETETVCRLAERVAQVLRMGTYCRMDFIRQKDTGIFYCLEANALPGMTPNSLLPQEARAAGMSYDQLCEFIVRQARVRT